MKNYEFAERKQAKAKVLVLPGLPLFLINGKSISLYFCKNSFLLRQIKQLFNLINLKRSYRICVTVYGGGLDSQAQAIMLGLAKIFSSINLNFRTLYQTLGFLKRDLRIKERKKYGLRKARKAPQYSKR